jgi:RNA polymerase sigma-70 factor (ECF subfamily)
MYGSSLLCAPPGDDISDGRSSTRATPAAPAAHDRAPQTPRPIGGVPVSELLAQLREGDQGALSVLYTELFGMLWSLAAVQTRSREAAKDIVQDVFFWLWSRREAIKLDTDIQVYLAVAVRNRARNLRRHHRVVDAIEQAVSTDVIEAPAIGRPPPPSDAAAAEQEFHAAYQSALAILTERERLAALLRWEEGFTLDQIGQVLSVSIEGTRKILIRAQNKVQAVLEDYRS